MLPSDERRHLFAAIARVTVETPYGEQRGTAFLVAAGYALTALHVVADRMADEPHALGPIRLLFPSGSVEATLAFHDRNQDFALLQLAARVSDASGRPLSPLPLSSLSEEDLSAGASAFVSFGFPEARPDGLWVSGQVRSTLSQVAGHPALQLFSDEAAAGQGAPLAGLSGAPVFVDGAVAGLLRWATLDEQGKSVAGSVFACPIAAPQAALHALSIPLPPSRCPYPGIVPFSPEQGPLFFGRRSEIGWLVENIRRHRLLLVIGASGSGKTSLVQAGLVPTLDQNIATRLLRPVADALPTTQQVQSQLRESHAERLVLIIDQLEEVLRLDRRPEQHALIRQVQTLTALSQVTVVLVLRADFFPELLASPLWPIEPAQRLEVAPLLGERLVEAIVEPARQQGVRVDPDLLQRLRSEVSDEPGALPLLQETLVLLWQRRTGRRLSLRAYEDLATLISPREAADAQSISGLGVALTLHAEAFLAAQADREQKLCRRTLLRLTQFGEGRPHTRRQQAWRALFAADDDESQTEALLQKLVQARLITTSVGAEVGSDGQLEVRPGEPPEVRVDLSHEVMLRAWPRLRRWLSEHRQAERLRRRLEQHAEERSRLKSQGGGLLDPVETREAEQFLQSADAAELGVSEAVRTLVADSRTQLERREAATRDAAIEKAKQALLLLEERATARARQWKIVATMTLLLFGSATVLLFWALRERRWAKLRQEQATHWAESEAEARKLALDKQKLATQRFLTAQAQVYRDDAPDLAALLGVAAETLGRSAESEGLLLQLLSRRMPLRRMIHLSGQPVRALAQSPDGKTLAAGFSDGQIWLIDEPSGKPKRAGLVGHSGEVTALDFSSDGKRLFSAGSDKLVRAWSVDAGASLGQPIGSPLAGHTTAIRSLSTSPDGKLLATGSDDGVILLWDQQTGELAGPPLREHQRAVMALRFSADGKQLLSGGDDQTVRLWDAKAARRIQVLLGAPNTVRAVALTGKQAAAGDWEGNLLLWDLATGKPIIKPQKGHRLSVSGLAVSPSGTMLYSASWDGELRRWRPETGLAFGPALRARQGALQTLLLRPDGQSLWSATDEGRLLELQIDERSPLELEAHVLDSELSSSSHSADGKLLAIGGWGKQVELWRATGDGLVRQGVLRGHDGSVSAVAISPDGKRLASADFQKVVKLWDVAAGSSQQIIQSGELVNALAFSPDGNILAIAGFDATVRLWDVRAGTERQTLRGHGAAVWSVAFSRDGKRLCSASHDQTLRVWDAQTGQAIGQPLAGHRYPVTSCQFLPDGERLLSGSEDKTLRLWDVTTGQTIGQPLRGHSGRVNQVALSPDGRLAVSVSEDETLRLWDVSSQQALGPGLLGHVRSATAVLQSPDGTKAYTVSLDGSLRVWDLSVSSWLRRACRLAGRDLSREERARFVGDVALPPLCEVSP
ncbi:MAG: hypothetical protein JNM40_26290 [Myxococcales bacterium]|nr:hypothetical protein [Myxococcales bacterium]